MNRLARLILLWAAVSAALAGCGPSVGFNSSTGRRSAKPAGAHIFIIDNRDPLPEGVTILGTITVKDAGMTVACDYPDVMRSATDQARKVGADAIKVLKVTRPDSWSTCWGVEVVAVAFGEADTTGLRESLVVTNEGFLEYVDASPCQDFGDPARIKVSNAEVLQLPFLLLTRFENATAPLRYPLTEKQINDHFSKALKEKHERARVADTSAHPGIAAFCRSVLENAARGAGSPLQWGRPIPPGVADSGAVLFLPIGIERRSGQSVEARLYLLVCDSRGEVIFSRCMNHRPVKWQSELPDFRDEIDGKIPLAE